MFSGIFTPKKDDNTTPPSTILKDERTEAVSVLTEGEDTFFDAVGPKLSTLDTTLLAFVQKMPVLWMQMSLHVVAPWDPMYTA